MKNVQDNFSNQAGNYAAYRPTYPDALYDFLFQIVPGFEKAWDCATGNGQVATRLAERFKTVHATDVSTKQIEHAIAKPNIIYEITRSEETRFANNSFDLITVGTALHWFDFDAFYAEVKRVAKPDAILAVWAYNLLEINEKIDETIRIFYKNELGKYWDKERKHVDESYTTIPFPFEQIQAPELYIEQEWTFDHLVGYLNSWSAVQHYVDANNENPLQLIVPKLQQDWGEGMRKVRFPLFMLSGKIIK